MIKFIAFHEAVTFPSKLSTLSVYNANEHARFLRVEETEHGFLFVCGRTGDRGQWETTGDTVEVYRSQVKYVTRTKAVSVAKLSESKPESKAK